ncbi:MAG: S46 family peptidase [Bacteroidales bacterium]|nr:S46 family peptidase [Bacteroidales bacterium]
MNKKLLLISILFLFVSTISIKADEGMWIPILLEKYNIADMQEKGFKLTAEDIYSVNNVSMKDAVVIFGRGCTGELISDQGLLLTNHHCGFPQIQKHSSLEHDYLTDGFWAMSKEEELVNPDLTVSFLIRMENVTNKILANVTDDMDESKRYELIENAIDTVKKYASENTHYEAIVKPFYFGNEYYLFVYEIFKDVRLVGAPPSSIGKFGGDTDNWMWPRHTGDFSLFRIYANKDNKPAEYSPDNVPYKPKKHFPISLKGVKKGDFTLVFGYPGRTSQYLTSFAVEMISKVENPHQIKLREKKLEILQADMDASDEVRIKYASKYASTSNYWKKWIGENRGLEKLNAIEKKQKLEEEFQAWVNSDNSRIEKYGNLLSDYKKLYKELTDYALVVDYTWEAGFSLEIVKFASKFRKIINLELNGGSQEEINNALTKLKGNITKFFKDYNMPTDKKVFTVLLEMYYDNIAQNFHPDIFELIENKFNGDFSKYSDYIYSKSILLNEKNILNLTDNFSSSTAKKISKDPAYKLYTSIADKYSQDIYTKHNELRDKIQVLNRSYITGLREMYSDKVFYPDANFTLRITYGKVDDYYPRDGVFYEYYTTLSGIIEKDNPDIYDYKVPEKLKELYKSKDYGRYGENSVMKVCFTGTNHTTGGNSGSPVLNADGYLIGINFDRNWEGTMSDIMYDPEQCRNITLDIRFTLFIIDKFAGAKHLVNEMTLIE